MNPHRGLAVAALVSAAVLAAGCEGGGKAIEISYDRPPSIEIPSGIKRLAIAEFAGATAEDKQWGDIASDKLASALDAYNKKYQRYELVDRKGLGRIMAERDLQMAISDASSAAKIGKLADVHAIIYGSVHVAARREHGTKTVPDLLRRSVRTVSYTREYSVVNVNFTMDDINTGRTLAAHAAKGEYDSEADKKLGAASIGRKLGVSSGDQPPLDLVTHRLIEECVEEFLAKIGPHSVRFVEKLEKGKTDSVKEGNEFAVAKEYADALKRYEQGIEERPDDDGAMFNAGLMYEVMGDLKKAEVYYDRAVGFKVKEKYITARKRARSEQQAEE